MSSQLITVADFIQLIKKNNAKIVQQVKGLDLSAKMITAVVPTLPDVGEEGILYFVPNPDGAGNNLYDEYLWIEANKKYEQVGSAEVDLSGYLKSTDAENTYAKKADLDDYLTVTAAADYAKKTDLSSYAKTSALSSYLTTATAADTYATKASLGDYAKTTVLADYLKSADAATAYAKKTDLDSYAKTSALSSYLTATAAANTYLTKTDASNAYATKSSLSSYATVASLADYLTSADAADTYATVSQLSDYAKSTDLASYLTVSSASSTYLKKTDAASTYATKASLGDYAKTSELSSYLTTTAASNTYATKTSLSDYAKTSALANYATVSSLSDYLTTADAASTYATVASLADYAKTSALSSYLTTTAASNTYATKTSLSDYAKTSALSSYLTTANASNTYLSKTDASKTYATKAALTEAIGGVTSISYSVVSSLPSSGSNGVIYLVPKSTSQTNNLYDEYIWLASSSKFEKIGDTAIDLSGYLTATAAANTYATKSSIPTKVSQLTNDAGYKTTDNNTTYSLTQDSTDGHKLTFAGSDGSSKTITIPDNNTTYSAATQSAAGLMSAADKKKLDGVATGANAYTLPAATTSALGGVKIGSNITVSSGTISLTKDNVTAALGYTPPTTNTTYSVATTSANGLMSSSDKSKLDGIAAGANAYTLPAATSSALGGVKVGSNITNSSGTISLTKANVTSALGYTPPTKDTTYSTATTSAAGLMSAADKTKLDGIAEKANNYTYTLPAATASALGGVKIGSNITISSGVISLTKANVTNALGYTPPTSDTTYSAATQSAAGLMSAADKKKLDGVAAGANAYTLPAATSSALGGVKVGSNITNSSGTISLTKANVTAALGYTPPTTNTTYSAATQSAAGLMSASDKTKLDGITISNYVSKANLTDKSLTQIKLGNYTEITDDEYGTMINCTGGIDGLCLYASNGFTDVYGKTQAHIHSVDSGINITDSGIDINASASGATVKINNSVALTASNYTSYVSKVGTSTVGSSTKPIYLNAGTPTACSYTLGSACAKSYTDSTSASAIGTGTSLVTERDVYYGLPTINGGHAYNSNTKIYAPTTQGSYSQVVKASGSTPVFSNYPDVRITGFAFDATNIGVSTRFAHLGTFTQADETGNEISFDIAFNCGAIATAKRCHYTISLGTYYASGFSGEADILSECTPIGYAIWLTSEAGTEDTFDVWLDRFALVGYTTDTDASIVSDMYNNSYDFGYFIEILNLRENGVSVSWDSSIRTCESYDNIIGDHNIYSMPCGYGGIIKTGYYADISGFSIHLGNGNIYSRSTPNQLIIGSNNQLQSCQYAYVLGPSNTVSSSYGLVFGGSCTTSAQYAKALGHGVTASNYASTAIGKYNAAMATGGSSSNTTGTAFVIGKGTSSSKSNALSVTYTGVLKTASTMTASTTADYAEYFEWQDGNPNGEDRVGKFVTIDGDKIKIATEGDYILGIVSGQPFLLGNGDCDVWNGMYLRDEFNRVIMEPAPKVEIIEIKDKKGNVIGTEEREVEGEFEGTRPVLNPDYDPTQTYINRADRPEWAPIGMLGVLAVYTDGTPEVNGFAKCNTDGIATKAQRGEPDSWRVIEKVADNIVKVIFK